ncbi:MAG: hypothetical protein HS104_07905 [Polyangiaceae bacterium]|nr:hypothetical protein [Polyangiaceae bacterium]
MQESHCPSGETCGADWKCTKKCTSDANCTEAGDPRCKLSVGYCVECLSSSDCGGKPCKSDGTCDD